LSIGGDLSAHILPERDGFACVHEVGNVYANVVGSL
jgi:hypothetical protein